MKSILWSALIVALVPLAASSANARDWYVSKSRGKGKKGTIEKPAKDLGNIINKLKPGDVIRIAGGEYFGKGKKGSDWIKVPVSIFGGFDETFKVRDPWGKHKTILTGRNKEGYVPQPRLHIDLSKYREKAMPQIVVDGLIINQGPQNNYKDFDKRLKLVRKASPKTGTNPSPDRGALIINVSKTGDLQGTWKIVVQNNIIANAAPTKGALGVAGHKNSEVTIRNNAIINCTGSSILAGSTWSGKGATKYMIHNNTVIFSWKYDAFVQSFSGVGVELGNFTEGTLANNVILMADRVGIKKMGKSPWVVKNNVVGFHVEADYYETSGDNKMRIADLEDEAEWLADGSEGNQIGKLKVPVSAKWAESYSQRTLIDRNKVEAGVKAADTGANQLRSILGLNLRAGPVSADSAVWLHEMSLDDVLKASLGPYSNYGASMPKVQKK